MTDKQRGEAREMTEYPTHLKQNGEINMVDVSAKAPTHRTAVAEGYMTVPENIWPTIRSGNVAKGDLWPTVRIAGIMAAKRTAELIPLCHPISLRHVEVEVALDDEAKRVVVQTRVSAFDVTGVEMEALVGVSGALLTLYDMLKGLCKSLEIGPIRLVAKTGGKSGDFQREAPSWYEAAMKKVGGEEANI